MITRNASNLFLLSWEKSHPDSRSKNQELTTKQGRVFLLSMISLYFILMLQSVGFLFDAELNWLEFDALVKVKYCLRESRVIWVQFF